MNDTSFAILPEKNNGEMKASYQSIGSLTNFTVERNVVHLQAMNGFVSLLFYKEDILRIVMNPYTKPSLQSSFAVIKDPGEVQLNITEQLENITISSNELKVVINKQPLLISLFNKDGNPIVEEKNFGMGFNSNKEVIAFKVMDEENQFYGFGEKTGFLNKRGEKYVMWNTDVYAPHNPEIDSLYQSIPYFMSLRKDVAYGIYFDNTFKSTFDMKSSSDSYSFSAEGGQLDYYIFGGPTPKDVIKQYTDITGRMPLPPKWALGYHQSRYSYQSEQEVKELVSTFQEKGIPLDAIHLDIHYMDEYRVFTFNKQRFPRPKDLINDLRELGVRTIPIVDPGVKKDPEYPIYREGVQKGYFCKYIEGDIYYGDVWPGSSAFPDFTSSSVREWWADKHSFYSDLGIEGIWNDMNEPAVFNESKTMDLTVMHENDGNPTTHKELHNMYGLLMGEATFIGMKKQLKGKRTFLLTRSGFAGIQRYAAVWTGDNRSFWEHLQMSMPMCMNLGISGVPFCGADVGGFAHDSNGELLVRWTQLGAFTPFFRNHSVLESIRQEPWSFGEKYEEIIKKYIQLRYVWLPYLYTLFKEASVSGIPVMRPLMLEYPDDNHTYNLSDQFLLGSEVIIAPIVNPSTAHRVVYLPKGKWVNYWTNELMEGGKYHLVEANLDVLPIFIKQGAIIPHGTMKKSTEEVDTEMNFLLYPITNEETSYIFYEDDGKTVEYEDGKYLEFTIRMRLVNNKLYVDVHDVHKNYVTSWNQVNLEVRGVKQNVDVVVNGQLVEVERDPDLQAIRIKQTIENFIK